MNAVKRLQAVRSAPVRAAVAIILALALAAAPAATAAVVRKKDRRAGVTFRLSGRHLTMKISEQANPRTQKKLLGKRVAAACGTSTTSGGKVYDKVFVWPKERASVGVDLDRDISRRVAYCLLEDARSGGDIALVEFR
jgi:hypothetical protein